MVLVLLPLQGSIHSAASAAATRTLDPSTTSRADKTPKVFIKLTNKRVTTKQHARVKVVVSPRSGARAAQSQRKLFGQVKVVVKGGGEKHPVLATMADHRTVVALPKLSRGVYRVQATFLGNQALGKSTSGSKTLTVVASGGAGPAGFPDASNTGVPAGTTLTPYTGSSTISKANTVIQGKTLGCIRVTAPGVVIRNSKISCGNSATDVVGSFDGDYTGTPLLLEDVEIDCQNTPGTAVGDALVTVRRADIHGCENGFDMNQNITVEDSYIHDLYNSAEAHTDGIQLAYGGHLVNGAPVQGALNITIRHNTIYGVGADGSLGTSAIISNGGDTNILIQDNLLAGGAYALYCDGGTAAKNYRVIGNHFSRKFSPKVGAYGPSNGCANVVQSDNVYQETGAPLPLG